jgi:hypothetical protein
LVRLWAHLGLDVGLADVEGDVTRDFQLELVIRRPGHLDAGALGCLFHLTLLLLHVFGPDVAAGCANGRADRGAPRGTAPAARDSTDYRAGCRADPGACRGVLFRLAHSGATRERQGADRSDGDESCLDGRIHEVASFSNFRRVDSSKKPSG